MLNRSKSTDSSTNVCKSQQYLESLSLVLEGHTETEPWAGRTAVLFPLISVQSQTRAGSQEEEGS